MTLWMAVWVKADLSVGGETAGDERERESLHQGADTDTTCCNADLLNNYARTL